MPPTARAALTLTASLLSASLWAAPVTKDGIAAGLAAIRTTAESSAPAALRQLEALQASVTDETPYPLRRALLRTEVELRLDAGQVRRAYAAERTALELALANGDPAGAALARLGTVRRLVDEGHPDDAQQEFEAILRAVPRDAPASVRVAFAIGQGDVHNARAQFDKALASYLDGLRLLCDDGQAGETRGQLYSYIARMYMNSDDAVRALQATERGLAERGLPVRTAGTLQFTQGIALMRLDRPRDGLAAFRRALDTAVRGGLGGLEASVRGNIADYHLRQHDYVAAEHEARLDLETSRRVDYQQLIIMARANLGFALMGQGQYAAGLAHVDGVIADLRRAQSWTDLDAMLDEKSRMLEGAGQYRQALVTVRDQQQLQQHNARLARDRAIALLQEKFDATQRNHRIAALHRENAMQQAELGSRRRAQRVTTFAAILTVLASALIFVLYRRARKAAAGLRQLNVQLEYHSMRDALTGLYNRRFFIEKMGTRATAAAGERRRPEPDEADCFVLMDIDHFKQINDRWGHDAGDAVLVEVARRLTLAVRDSDMLLRWGGEEFLIYAPSTSPAHIAELVDRVLSAVGATPVDAGARTVPVTLTAGVAALPAAAHREDGSDWQGAIRLADWALYQGKAGGRNQAHIVARMAAPLDAVLAAVEGAGPVHGLVEVREVRGPGLGM